LAGLAGFEPTNARVKVKQAIDFTVFFGVRKDYLIPLIPRV